MTSTIASASRTGDSAVVFENVSVRVAKTFALHEMTLNVPRGSIYGFLGPNGSGKTTTIRTMLGMLRPNAGEVRVLGHPVPDHTPRALIKLGYVPERPHLYRDLTVRDSIAFHRSFYPKWDASWADELQSVFGLRSETKVSRLSKGETGKLLILLALAQRPELLVLDEPTDGLDPVVRRDVLSAVLDYVAQEGATVFISSHLIHELERICDWVGVMESGRLIAEMPMQSFREGIKRLRVARAPSAFPQAPFNLLARADSHGNVEEWIVRGWQDPMRHWFEGVGAELREVLDLDLEESFVELLRSARSSHTNGSTR